MMKRETIAIADNYIPIKRRATLEQKPQRPQFVAIKSD